MNEISLGTLFGILIALIFVSAFFSGSETAMMSLNKYRLRHMSKNKHGGAIRASRLLDRPDRLIGLILLGNNFVNILASSIATIIALRVFGEPGIAIATFLLTLVILLFAEVTPKTLAVLHPEQIAFPAAFILGPLLKLLYPFVWFVNVLANGMLRLLGVSPDKAGLQHLDSDELRTVVHEAGALIPRRHQRMLLSILDLENVSVDDIMIPRNEIVGVDLENDWEDIMAQLSSSQHTQLPIFKENIDNVSGYLHVRQILPMLARGDLDKEQLQSMAHEPYFVPEGTALNTQLLNFQRLKTRLGLVINEYGDIQGLVTLSDILEEIVGEFTYEATSISKDIHPQDDGSYFVDGGANIRELNRAMHWELPTDGPKTVNGLILEYLETIPESGTSVRIAGYPIEILNISGNAVKTVRVIPLLRTLKK